MQKNNDNSNTKDPSIEFGKILAYPPPGEEIVISGMAGLLPKCENIEEFQNSLFNKVDLVTQLHRVHADLSIAAGKLKDSSRFDAGFFGLHKKHVLTMNPLCKLLLEKSVECIMDAGLNPSDLAGTNTGVFLGICFTECESHWYLRDLVKGGAAAMGNIRGMYANHVSEYLKLKGPSLTVDTACSSSGFALETAYRAIRMGHCEAAIVGGANLVIGSGFSLQFARLGVLSDDGYCRPFDANGTGYVRSEAIVAILLQKLKASNRIYAKVVHTKTNSDGYKEQGITYPSGAAQYLLLKDIYEESEVDPLDISYMEPHGTGTVVGDPEELNSVDRFFRNNRRGTLLIGSVKSSIGHSEPTATLCSIIKVLLAFETNMITPNINYNSPRKNILGIVEDRLEVVLENTPFRDTNGLVGVSSFGFGGANMHMILKRCSKEKVNHGTLMDNMPRLVCVSGRTEEAVRVLLEGIGNQWDSEYIGLIHNIFRKPVRNHLYRGYAIIITGKGLLHTSVKLLNPNKTKLHIHFGGLAHVSGDQLSNLLDIPTLKFLKTRISEYFNNRNLNIHDGLYNSSYDKKLNTARSLLAQLIVAELLKLLELKYEGISANSFGKPASNYYQDSFTFCKFLDIIIELVKSDGNKTTNTDANLISGLIKDGTSLKNIQNILGIVPVKNSLILIIGETECAFPKNNVLVKLSDFAMTSFLEVIGRLYQCGLQPQIQNLYPKVQLPVSRGTSMISPKIKWKHDYKHFIPSFGFTLNDKPVTKFQIHVQEDPWTSLDGHIIDGRNLFPASGYLYLVWCVLGNMLGRDKTQLNVVFENCNFKRACSLPHPSSSSYLVLTVMVHKESGNFEVSESAVPVATGRIRLSKGDEHIPLTKNVNNASEEYILYTKDVYKELRIRGYNYKGSFKSILQSNVTATYGKIRWTEDWITFIDNMLQMKILGVDTRMLYVPTHVSKLIINSEDHLKCMKEFTDKNGATNLAEAPVIVNRDSGEIRCGGILIRGLMASSISKKKIIAFPVLEKYMFIPNETKLELEQCVRVIMQIALENNCGLKVKVAEIIHEGSTDNNIRPLGPIIKEVLEDQPLVHCDVTILSSDDNMLLDVGNQNRKLKYETDFNIVVGRKIISRNVLEDAIKATTQSGFILSREPLTTDISKLKIPNLVVLNTFETLKEKLVLLKKSASTLSTRAKIFINVHNNTPDFKWLTELKVAVKTSDEVIVWCQNEPLNGIIGLVNCLRKEPDCCNIRCLFILDKAPNFDPKHRFYQSQLDKGMGINIYMNGAWGTYRHLLLGKDQAIKSEHCFANNTVRGDISSIKWIEGPLYRNMKLDPNESIVEVYYSSLNFRDVMTASGKLHVDAITRDRREQECVQGIEFSGKTLSGRRVMGILVQGTLATLVRANNNFLWDLPKHWSLKHGATIPIVYGTCIYGLFVEGKIKSSDTVLIHSGTGGIGQAAINLCLNLGCTVFTTVGTEEKRLFIKEHFPQIAEQHIGSSRDLTFEQMIMKETNGRGVDVILNSLSEEKLMASVRCLARNGRFLEIGKFDLMSNNQLNLLPLTNGRSYYGIMFDSLMRSSENVKQRINSMLKHYINTGAIKPLKMNIFPRSDVGKAFKFMASGKHIGKVLVEIRDEDECNISNRIFTGIPRYFCNPLNSYVICGGLGGFGLELADWLVLRGAKKLVLTSRKGITTGYQKYRTRIWESYGCEVIISTHDITTKSGCEVLIAKANLIAPVAAIFNLAVVLEDAILENQTEHTFEASFLPKAHATQYLDEVSKAMCPELRDFVVFSSVSCGKGNAGQTNYGMANSVMERICEKRRLEGYPALAIQWGAFGDVGLVAELQENDIELVIGGTLQQRIANCLQVMDILLRQNEATVVSSTVVAEKKLTSLSENVTEAIGTILGIADIKSVSPQSSLADLGMDSMIEVEIKQTLEREYNIFLSPAEIKSITLARLKELQESSLDTKTTAFKSDGPPQEMIDIIKVLLATEEQKSPIINMKTKTTSKDLSDLSVVIILPGIEGVCSILMKLAEMLEVQAYGVNYLSTIQEETIPKIAEFLFPYIKELLQPNTSFNIIAHSLGCDIALEIVDKLETLGYLGTVTMLDGAPEFLKEVTRLMTGGDTSDAGLEKLLTSSIARSQLNNIESTEVMGKLTKLSSLEEKINCIIQHLKLNENFTEGFVLNAGLATFKRMRACYDYIPNMRKLKSKVTLFKPTLQITKFEKEDYELQKYFEEVIEIKVFEGTHSTFLQNAELAKTIMEYI